jgi:SagB-type dehydrogenase family enzyme
MTMKLFTNSRAGVSGLKPGGWTAQDLGLWVRASDEALLFQRGIPNMTAEQIKVGLIPLFDFPRLQERTGQHQTTSFEWDLYHVEAGKSADNAMLIDAALAQAGEWAYVILLASKPSAYQTLHDEVFLPALNALTPVFTGPDATRIAQERTKKYAHTVQTFRKIMKSSLSVQTDWVSDQMKGMVMPLSQKTWEPNAELIDLPQPDKSVLTKTDLMACIADRKSRRKYSTANLTLAELSYLLWATQGVRMGPPSGRHYRTVPSAGSRHSFETYLVIQRVEGLKTGIYRYLPFEHKLVYLFTAENLPKKMTTLTSGQPFVGNSAVCFIWSSIPYRMEWRYGFDSERVILMDVGHVCQNLYLAAESIGCGTCGVAAYEQERLDQFLGLDGKDEFVIYLAPVGKIGASQDE